MDTASLSPPASPDQPISPPPAGRGAGGGGRWATVLVVLTLLLFFGPAYFRHAVLSANPTWFNDDARQQIWPLMRYHDERLFPNDAIADYYLACFPIGYRAVYLAASPLLDAKQVSKVLPYLLLALTAYGAGQAARRLRGPAAGWAAVALCLGGSIYLSRLAGGLPRGFAFPLLGFAALALARGKPLVLAAVTILSGAFYPAVAVVCGLALASWLLLPAKWLGKAQEWHWRRRLIVLGTTAALTVLVILPNAFASADYGPVLRPADAAAYPELSAAGRYQQEDRADDAFSGRAAKNFLEAALSGIGERWDPSHPSLLLKARSVLLMLLMAAGLVGFVLLLRSSPPGRRMLLLPAVALIAYVASVPLVPLLYLPTRYQLYPFAITALVIVPAGIAHLATAVFRHVNQRRTQAIVMLATVGPYLLFFSAWNLGIDNKKVAGLSELSSEGLKRQVVDHQALYAFLSKLKISAVIAGWPEDMDNVPYLTGRSVLVSREGHQAFHKVYADMMRARVRSIIAALYDPEITSVEKLRDDPQFLATHLVIDRDLYGQDVPTYFAPFDADIAAARQRLGGRKPAAMLMQLRGQIVFDDGHWLVIDLRPSAKETTRPALAP